MMPLSLFFKQVQQVHAARARPGLGEEDTSEVGRNVDLREDTHSRLWVMEEGMDGWIVGRCLTRSHTHTLCLSLSLSTASLWRDHYYHYCYYYDGMTDGSTDRPTDHLWSVGSGKAEEGSIIIIMYVWSCLVGRDLGHWNHGLGVSNRMMERHDRTEQNRTHPTYIS